MGSKFIKRYFSTAKQIKHFTKNVGILGVPFEKGTNRPGVIHGPDCLRKACLIDRLNEVGDLTIVDYGNLEMTIPSDQVESPIESMLWLPQVAACNQALSPKVASILNDDRVCVTLGGDHSIGIGTVDGHCTYSEDPVVFWIDAHADINTNATTPSRNLNGMPLALLVKELKGYWPELPTMKWLTPKLSIKNLAYIGLRSVDPYERLLMHKYNIPAFGMDDIQRYGIDAIVNLALQRVDPDNKKSIHASFDVDALDALEAPSTTIPLRGGLTLREAIYTMEKLHNTGRLRAIDIVEMNPTVGSADDVTRTIDAVVEVIKAGLGHQRKGTMPIYDDIPLPKVAV